jgi:hypothetical protein
MDAQFEHNVKTSGQEKPARGRKALLLFAPVSFLLSFTSSKGKKEQGRLP